MGSFFKNIIHDSRNGMPAVAQKTVSSFARTLPESQRQYNSADPAGFEFSEFEPEIKSDKTTLSNSAQPQSQVQIPESAKARDALNTSKIEPNVSRAANDMTASPVRHKHQTIVPEQSANGSEYTDEHEYRADSGDTPIDYQTQARIDNTQKKQDAAQKLISDNFVASKKGQDNPIHDIQNNDSLFESVRKPAQYAEEHVALDQPVYTESCVSTQDIRIDSDTGSGLNRGNASLKDAFQPRNEAAIKDAADQSDHDASEFPTVTVNKEIRIETHAVKPAADGNRKDAFPRVNIGMVNVIVEGPKITQGKQATVSNSRRDDQTSRHYLRSL